MKKRLMALANTVGMVGMVGMAGMIWGSSAIAADVVPQRPGDQRSRAQYLADCAKGVTPDTCVASTVPRNCPVGQKWSNAGGVAHCVLIDPACPAGTILVHDRLGNPACQLVHPPEPERPPIPPEPPALPEPPDPPRPPDPPAPNLPVCSPSHLAVNTFACPPGSSGSRINYRVVDCDASGNSVTRHEIENHCTREAEACSPSAQVRSTTFCQAGEIGGPIQVIDVVSCPGSVRSTQTVGECQAGPVTCTPGVFPNADQPCPSGYTGTTHANTTVTCPAGPYGIPLYSQSEPDLSLCNPVPSCPNQAKNPPLCSVFDPCTNGAGNPPACNDNQGNCPALPGPLGDHWTWPSYCQGTSGVPAGRWGDRYQRVTCGYGASGCYCQAAWQICIAGRWGPCPWCNR